MQNEMVGRQVPGKRRIVHLYSKRSDRLWKVTRIGLMVLSTPIWLPFFLILHAAQWCEVILDAEETWLDKILHKIIPRNL